jgi:succinate dehydrogenase hydrophobic anchor subunit
VANATSSGGMSSTSSGLMATGTVTGNGNIARTAFLFSLFTALAMVFSVVWHSECVLESLRPQISEAISHSASNNNSISMLFSRL